MKPGPFKTIEDLLRAQPVGTHVSLKDGSLQMRLPGDGSHHNIRHDKSGYTVLNA
jgi:hypothetical protein